MSFFAHRRRFVLLVCVLSISTVVRAQESSSVARADANPRVIRVLTIGNSFAQNACRFLNEIAESEGSVQIEIGTANLGGCTLERHATLAAQSAADPSQRPYPGPGGKRYGLQEYLRLKPWDYVTVQQMSALSYKPETYHPYVEQLVGTVKDLSPSARILIHQTWAYRPDSELLLSEGLTQGEMYQRLRDSYDEIARQFQCPIIPVGTAFQLVRSTPGHEVLLRDLDYDYDNPEYPKLPKQTNSLVTGWFWKSKDGGHELSLDFKHGNNKGCYLAGLVWFESLTGIDANKTTFVPQGVGEADATFFREIAHRVVSGRN